MKAKGGGTPTVVNILRIWLGLVGIMAIANTLQCFMSPTYLYDRLYTVREQNVTGLSARLFGVWTLLAGGLRLMCAIDIQNRTLYHVTLFSFVLAFGHFVSEVFIFETATFTAGIIAPLIVSSFSILLMSIGYFFISDEDPRAQFVNENEEILKSDKKKLR